MREPDDVFRSAAQTMAAIHPDDELWQKEHRARHSRRKGGVPEFVASTIQWRHGARGRPRQKVARLRKLISRIGRLMQLPHHGEESANLLRKVDSCTLAKGTSLVERWKMEQDVSGSARHVGVVLNLTSSKASFSGTRGRCVSGI